MIIYYRLYYGMKIILMVLMMDMLTHYSHILFVQIQEMCNVIENLIIFFFNSSTNMFYK